MFLRGFNPVTNGTLPSTLLSETFIRPCGIWREINHI